MAETERHVKPTLRPFYKEFGRGRKFGPNGIQTECTNFFGEHSTLNWGPSAVSLGSLEMGKLL